MPAKQLGKRRPPLGAWKVTVLLAVMTTACAPERDAVWDDRPLDRTPVARAVYELTQRPTRVLWLRDQGDGTDYLARGTQLELVGFDSEDDRGERVILPAGQSIAKPLFTVNGDRIVFSNRDEGTMHIIDWAGGESRLLGEGFALHTWRDPRTRVEWLYFAHDLIEDGKTLPNYRKMDRMPLSPYPANFATVRLFFRRHLRPRRVWRQTAVSEDSYQLSADGRFASAPFPWPEVGVHDVRARRWNRHGRGCWVAMAPDNSYLFWIMDGPHRNVIMERIGGTETDRWTVNINSLPDTDRYEVYHPRWSNHPRVMTISGPYTEGEGAYRLPGGGTDVQIWVGRFSPDHRHIEHWVRVSYNNHANFYPDVWVQPDAAGYAAASSSVAAVGPDTPAEPVWPAVATTLRYLWQHAAAQNEIEAPDGGPRTIFRPEARGWARFAPRHTMEVTHGYFVDEHGPALKPPFSMEMWLTPDASLSDGDQHAWVAGYSVQHGLFVEQDTWIWRWDDQAIALGTAALGGNAHVTVNVTPEHIELWVNGALQARTELLEPLTPRLASPLFFGGHPQADPQGWSGRISHIALHDRSLTPGEIFMQYQLSQRDWQRFSEPEREMVRARVVEESTIPRPEDIAPYRRGLVANTYERVEGDRKGERFMAAHWVILDGKVLPGAVRPQGRAYTLSLAPFDDHAELEGERLSIDHEDFTLRLYYDLKL